MSVRRRAYRAGAAMATAHAVRRGHLGRRIVRRHVGRRVVRLFR